MRRRAFLALLVAVVIAGAAYHFLWRHHVKRLQVVREGVLYRVAQPSELGLEYLVRRRGVRTIVSLRLEDDPLRRGWFDAGQADGAAESDFVAGLGVRHLQWPMGREACWPWVTPWQFEAFFKLMDDPANWPVAVHCVGGRHRTGTLSALFRLEYDRWPIERVLAEMYSFQFGPPIPLQEYNLRTYMPRPRPSESQWIRLRREWTAALGEPPGDYDELVRRARAKRGEPAVDELLDSMIEGDRPFALPLAARLILDVNDPPCAAAAAAAARCLARSDVSVDGISAAAALVADFGSPEQQRDLLRQIEEGGRQAAVSPHYDALVSGVANRYTPNRVAFLKPLLSDERPMPRKGAGGCRYCDLAIVRLAAIADQRLLPGGSRPRRDDWERGRALARQWLTDHADAARLCRLQPPTVHTQLQADSTPTSCRDATLRR